MSASHLLSGRTRSVAPQLNGYDPDIAAGVAAGDSRDRGVGSRLATGECKDRDRDEAGDNRCEAN